MPRMPLKSIAPRPEVEKFRNEVLDVVKVKCEQHKITDQELLGVLAYTVGACLAMQDQRIPVDLYLAQIDKNIEAGNAAAIKHAMEMKTEGSA